MRILLVEDDELLGDGIRTGLSRTGCILDWVREGRAAETALATETYDAVVLDLGLPGKSGLDVLRDLRARGDAVLVLVLTARDTVQDRVAGLDGGADDYMLKPFDLDELAARLRALGRRARGRSSPLIERHGISLNPAARSVSVHGHEVDLSQKEFTLLEHLLDNYGKVMTRERLMGLLSGWDQPLGSNVLEVYVSHLRKKLGVGRDVIRTVRGVGYLIE